MPARHGDVTGEHDCRHQPVPHHPRPLQLPDPIFTSAGAAEEEEGRTPPFAIAVPRTLPWVQRAPRAAGSSACVPSGVRPERKPLSKHLTRGKTHFLARMAKTTASTALGRTGDAAGNSGIASAGHCAVHLALLAPGTHASGVAKHSAVPPSLSPPSLAPGSELPYPIISFP